MLHDAASWRDKTVCVTGGTGLLGYQIVKLLLDLGARVRVLSLPPPGYHPLLKRNDVEWSLGDVRDADLCARALVGCDVVFHTAGVVSVWGPSLAKVWEVHVSGTRNVLAAAAPTTRVVHTSSIVAVGATRDGRPLDEESPFTLDKFGVDYVLSKRQAESIALSAAERGQDVVVVNPGYLVGPEDFERSVMGRFCRSRFWRGQLPLALQEDLNLVDVRDVALGHLLAAERGVAGRRYILGGENRTFPDFMATLAAAAGLRPRAIPRVPWWCLAAAATLAEGRSRVTRRAPYPSLQLARMNRYYWFYQSDRAARELGFQPRPLAQSLDETHRWCGSVSRLTVRGFSRWWMRPDDREPSHGRRPHRITAPSDSMEREEPSSRRIA